jgi:hypothetical protein
MKCEICGVEAQAVRCDACKTDTALVNAYDSTSHDGIITRLMNMPDHLFFFALRTIIRKPNKVGGTFNEALLAVDPPNNFIWERLKGYRGFRGGKSSGKWDRWATNPLLS